jgi:histidinol-phosphate/aromatic aminotransferase/cobyric acid decarboxylase-like protein
MSRFWSSLTHDLKPYVPGEQPRMAELVKLNTNESPLGPSPRALEAIRGELRWPATTGYGPNKCSSATARTRCWRMRLPRC